MSDITKWYEDKALDKEIVISSRVRLARNLKKYPFSKLLSDEKAKKMTEEIVSAIKNDRTYLSNVFEYRTLNDKSAVEKTAMVENHIISPELVSKKSPCGVLLQNDEAVSILVNEEDHIRIQAIASGYDIDKAWESANRIDDLIEESVEYAFDKTYGYLTACPSNTGTGLRASFMLHLPVLERTGRLRAVSQSLAKFGMTLRGIYGEGSEPLGSIYQISNQVTLGKSEQEIIEGLKNLTMQIVEQEKNLRNEFINRDKIGVQDSIYRAYGTAKFCKRISSSEAMKILSDLRLGVSEGIIESAASSTNIYNTMMNIQQGNLQRIAGSSMSPKQRDELRADYLNKIFS